MTVEELQTLIAAKGATAHVAIGVVWFATDGYRTASAALDEDLKREFGELATRSVGRVSRLTSQAYSVGDDLTRAHIGSMPIADLSGELIHPKAGEALRDMRKLGDADPLRADALEDVPAFYALVWRTTKPAHTVLFGRRLVRQSIARRRNKIVARIAGDEATLRKFEGQLIFFDEDFDWILAEDTFFILKPRLFEDAFLNESELKRAVGGNARRLHAKVPIKNLWN